MLDNYVMQDYDHALRRILESGVIRTNKRTGISTRSIFGVQCRYSLDGRFPLLTRRKIWPKSIFAELLWFLSGSTNNKDLQALGSNIWTPWVDEQFEKKNGFIEGSLGPVYGFQLRHFGGHYGDGSPASFGYKETNQGSEYEPIPYGDGGFDQLLSLINRIKEDPSCRRLLFDLWNPADLHRMRLAPCHYTFQVMIDDDRRMTTMLTQRSADFPVGVPANIQFYSALTIMLAQQTDCIAHEFVHSMADAHIYENQIGAVNKYLNSPIVDSPYLKIHKAADITSYTLEDFQVSGYNPGPKIETPVAV